MFSVRFRGGRLALLAGVAAIATLGRPAGALFTGSCLAPTGNTLAASAYFSTYRSGDIWHLDVLLTNASADVSELTRSDTLTGLFFSFASPVTLTPVAATLPDGTKVWHNGSPIPGHTSNVGGEWAYVSGLTVGGSNDLHGIGSAGFGLFGPSDRFDTHQNLSGPNDPNGLQYGILPAISSWPSDWNPTMIEEELISNAVRFTFSTGSTELAVMPNGVWAQYGTDLREPRFRLSSDDIPPEGIVPEPTSLALAGGTFALAVWRRRRR